MNLIDYSYTTEKKPKTYTSTVLLIPFSCHFCVRMPLEVRRDFQKFDFDPKNSTLYLNRPLFLIYCVGLEMRRCPGVHLHWMRSAPEIAAQQDCANAKHAQETPPTTPLPPFSR